MSGLVLTTWKVEQEPDNQNASVNIRGREGGLLAWVLAHVGVDPVTSIEVNTDRLEFSQASLSGTQQRLIPLQNICSTYYGYHKPWKVALGIMFSGPFMASSVNGVLAILILLAGIVGGVLYYFLNRTLTLGFVEHSGVISGIQFKRSIIENVDINADEARKVCNLVQALIERKNQRL